MAEDTINREFSLLDAVCGSLRLFGNHTNAKSFLTKWGKLIGQSACADKTHNFSPGEFLLLFSFFNFKLYLGTFIVGVLERYLALVRWLLLSSLPLSCALEHSCWALEWMQMRAFSSTNAQLTAGCYISILLFCISLRSF